MTAIKDIQPGEEIYDSYIGIYNNHEIRQIRLFCHWGFNCNCKLCKIEKEKMNENYPIKEEDEAKIQYEDFLKKLFSLSNLKTSDEVNEKIKIMLKSRERK